MEYRNMIIFGTFLSVFILLTTSVFANVVNIETCSENTYYDDKEQVYVTEDVKHLLFQTVIDFTKDEDFLKILDLNGYDFVMNTYDFRVLYGKLIMKNPMIIISLLKTKPTLSEDYLEIMYKQGVEISNLLDESEINSLIDSIKLNDEDIKEEMKDKISSNSRLQKNIDLIDDLNCNCNYDKIHYSNELSPQVDSLIGPPIRCFILFCIFLPLYIYFQLIRNLTNKQLQPYFAHVIAYIIGNIAKNLNCLWVNYF
jgi:hypothetical protein